MLDVFDLVELAVRQRGIAVPVLQASHSGAMIAFYPSPELAKRLAVGGGEKPEDLHVTLCILDEVHEALPHLLEEFVLGHAPVRAKISGLGRFNTDEGDGDEAFYASVDAPDLPQFRQALVKHLEYHEIQHNREHGYTPHLTLAYVPKGEPNPTEDVETAELTFDRVSLVAGDERQDFELRGKTNLSRGLVFAPPKRSLPSWFGG
jgi:2'-5' RNA ligase